MKKLILGIAMLAIVSTIIFVACTKNVGKKESFSTTHEQSNQLRATTVNSYYNSKWTQKFGLDSIVYQSTTTGTENFQLFGKSHTINGISLNLNSSTLSVNKIGNIITINVSISSISQNIQYTLNTQTKEVFDVTNNETVDSIYLENELKNTYFSLAYTLYDATYNPSPETPIVSGIISGGGGGRRCEMDCMYISHKRSKSVAGCHAFVAKMCSPTYGCTPSGTFDTGCLWEDFGCVTTSSVFCPC